MSTKVFHDLNSPFKIYRREVLENLPQLGSMFRFSLLFANNQGYRTIEIPTTHRKRLYGKSKFGLRKYFRILYDLILILLLLFSFKSLRTPVKTMMKKLLTYLVVGLSFGFLIWKTLQSWSQVPPISWNFNFVNVVILFAFFISIQILNIISWHLITKAVGSRVTIQKDIKIWTFSSLSRFIPGLIWPFASRVYLATQDGISKKNAILATAVEPILNLFTGLFVLASVLIFWQLPIKIEPLFIIIPFVPLVAVLILLGNKYVLKKITWLITKNEPLVKDLHLPFSWILTLSAIFIGHFILAGLALFWLVNSIFPSLSLSLLPTVIGIFTLSWLIGYVVIFAPGGLGVMELSLTGLLAFYLPISLAALIALLFRIFLIAGEGLTAAVVFYFFRDE